MSTQNKIVVLFLGRMHTGWETRSFCHKREEISLRRFVKITKGLEIITYEEK